jgi:ATP-dependent Clp protease ATP-binding subunit ClpA
VAVNVLRKRGLDLENVRAQVEKQVGTGPEQRTIGVPQIPYTPRVMKVIALAQKEAKQLHHTYVGTEHVLLGLLREGDGVAAKVLRALDVDIEQTRTEILRELDPNFSINRLEEQINTAPKEASAMQPRDELPQDRKPDSAGAGKRYDIYCIERSTEMIVYRNAIFKGIKRLLNSSQQDSMGQFIELEQANGQTIFVSRFSVIKFCEPGTTPGGERIPPP